MQASPGSARGCLPAAPSAAGRFLPIDAGGPGGPRKLPKNHYTDARAKPHRERLEEAAHSGTVWKDGSQCRHFCVRCLSQRRFSSALTPSGTSSEQQGLLGDRQGHSDSAALSGLLSAAQSHRWQKSEAGREPRKQTLSLLISATVLCLSSVPLRVLPVLCGHRNVNMVQSYLFLSFISVISETPRMC